MAARLLLVYSPLVGRATWDLVAAHLAGRGHQVGVPDLTGTVAAGPPYCPRQAEVIAGSASGEPAILNRAATPTIQRKEVAPQVLLTA